MNPNWNLRESDIVRFASNSGSVLLVDSPINLYLQIRTSHDLDSFQIIDHHIPPYTDPSPPEPPHLALMCRRHGPLRLSVTSRSTQEKHRARNFILVPYPQDARQHGKRSVKGANIFAHNVDRGESVERNGAFPTHMPVHEGFEEGDGAVVERYVVCVGGDAIGVKRYDGVESCNGRLGGGNGGHLRSKGGG